MFPSTVPDLPPRLATALADRYRLERELGAGGMATVYLARDLKHDRDVAIRAADHLMYKVKRSGKNRVLVEDIAGVTRGA